MKNKKKDNITRDRLSTDYELARWSALYWGVNLIADVAEAKNIPFEQVHIDQPALDKYVDELSDDILHVFTSNQQLKDNHFFSV